MNHSGGFLTANGSVVVGNIGQCAGSYTISGATAQLNTPRLDVYKKAWTAREAIDFVHGASGRMFDPAVVGAFEAVMEPRAGEAR